MFFSAAAMAMGLATTMTDDNACQGLERLDFKVRAIFRQQLSYLFVDLNGGILDSPHESWI